MFIQILILLDHSSVITEEFGGKLCKSLRYTELKTLTTINFADNFYNNSCSIVSSMEFDKDDQFFATAGVRRKIKIFEVESLLDVDGYNDENTLKNKFISKIKSNHSSNSIDKSLFEEDIDDFRSLDTINNNPSLSQMSKYPILQLENQTKIR